MQRSEPKPLLLADAPATALWFALVWLNDSPSPLVETLVEVAGRTALPEAAAS